MKRSNCGILALQGCIEPHELALGRLGVAALKVRSPEDLEKVEALILPGGESTTMLRLIRSAGLFEPLQQFSENFPMWGICAGAILMAKEVCHPHQESLGVMSIRATRNFYGSQRESFKASIEISGLKNILKPKHTVEVDFIRAPMLEALSNSADEPHVSVLAAHQHHPVMLQQGHLLATSFHIELGEDSRLHEYFVSMPSISVKDTAAHETEDHLDMTVPSKFGRKETNSRRL